MRKKIFAVIAALALMCGLLTSCGQTVDADSGKLRIVCSIFAPYDFARQITGDRAEVKMLLSPGVESHAYEPTPNDIISIENADLFFYVSEHTETWISQILESVENPQVKEVELAAALGLEIHGHEHEHGEHEHEHEHEDENELDEHIWTSPKIAVKMIEAMTEKICASDPDNSEFYAENSQKYISEIKSLDSDFRSLTANSARKEIVSGSRFAMKNFTAEYGLDYTAAFDSCVDNTEPSAAVIAKIIDKIETDNIPVIFYEELTEPKIADMVSQETGAKMLLLHSCHNVSFDELKSGATYVSLMRQNYLNLKEALN